MTLNVASALVYAALLKERESSEQVGFQFEGSTLADVVSELASAAVAIIERLSELLADELGLTAEELLDSIYAHCAAAQTEETFREILAVSDLAPPRDCGAV
ncbi:hypothetical protein ACQ143_02440 [Microbacterium sp. MC2]